MRAAWTLLAPLGCRGTEPPLCTDSCPYLFMVLRRSAAAGRNRRRVAAERGHHGERNARTGGRRALERLVDGPGARAAARRPATPEGGCAALGGSARHAGSSPRPVAGEERTAAHCAGVRV